MNKAEQYKKWKAEINVIGDYQKVLASQFYGLTHRQLCEVEHQSGSNRRLMKRWLTGETMPSMFKFNTVLQCIDKVISKELDTL
jgi:hypothetical protein